ncbi:MAG: aminotransferase class I/II [Terriglobia bacterium]|nr:MAG: aminotransferase class I/II [Terriglobia bacterium]
MLDFTSALYLGLAHDHASLRPWKALTAGKPAALHTLPGTPSLAAELAALMGCEAASLGPSTLHLFFDLFETWPAGRATIYADAELYETAWWGVGRAAARHVPVRRFRHYDADSLSSLIRRDACLGRRPVVVADGFCPGCGLAAPIAAFLECIRSCGGWLVIDDTQALGVLGRGPSARVPYGLGGGGTMQWLNVRSKQIIVISSLAKAFGAPLAVFGGTRSFVVDFERRSLTRVHCSPASAAAVHAAEQALLFNQHAGDRTRQFLSQLVARLRQKVARAVRLCGGYFPVQSTPGVSAVPAVTLQERLAAAEIATVLQRDRATGQPRVGMLLTAQHSIRDVDRLAAGILAAIQ